MPPNRARAQQPLSVLQIPVGVRIVLRFFAVGAEFVRPLQDIVFVGVEQRLCAGVFGRAGGFVVDVGDSRFTECFPVWPVVQNLVEHIHLDVVARAIVNVIGDSIGDCFTQFRFGFLIAVAGDVSAAD